MKAVIPPSAEDALDALLDSHVFLMAELYTFTLIDGTILRYADYEDDLTFQSHAYSSDGPVFKRGTIKSAIGMQVDTLELSLGISPTTTINGLLANTFVDNGNFDGATLTVDRAYMDPADELTVVGALNLFTGNVGEIDGGRSAIHMVINDPKEMLNISLPKRVYQGPCLHTLYGPGCTLVKASFANASSVLTGSTRLVLNCGLAQAAHYFELGVVTFTSGANNGVSRTVKIYAPGVLTLSYPLPNTPAIADTFNAYPGCDKKKATCESSKFNNVIHFFGTPFIPAPETSY